LTAKERGKTFGGAPGFVQAPAKSARAISLRRLPDKAMRESVAGAWERDEIIYLTHKTYTHDPLSATLKCRLIPRSSNRIVSPSLMQ
jgi:hypothetical protein